MNILSTKHLLPALALGVLCACDSDQDLAYLLGGDDSLLGGGPQEIVLTPDTRDALALTLYWSGDGRLTLSDPALQAPVDAAVSTIQFSADEQFSAPLDIATEKGASERQFLGDELNGLLGRMGYTAGNMAPLWIRVRSALAANIEPQYTNTLRLDVQSYRISLQLAKVLDASQGETAMTLASPEENGIYQGFMGVGGWENWWLRENNNVVWGNLGESGKTFYASSDESHWNFWFPEPSGCYFSTVNTVEGWWSALHIDNIAVSGDIAGEMTFNKKTMQWSLPVSLPAAKTISVALAGRGSLYDRETTDAGPAKEQAIGFAGTASDLAFGQSAGTIEVAMPAGETALVLDLSNPMALTLAAGEAAQEPAVSQQLYFSGVTDWNGFDTYLTLYDESSLSYGGAHWIDSEWGYRAYTAQEWSPAYKAADGATPLAGNLVLAETDGNIPAPERGLYVMDFNMKQLSYTLTPVETVAFVGLGDDWSEHTMTQSADNPEVFTAEFVKEKETPWGVKVLINHDWALFFGGSAGTLRLGHSDATTGFDGDNDLETGKTYVLTVDLGKQTYRYSSK